MNIVEEFLKYISIDTTSDSTKNDTPSTKGQFELANLLVEELQALNVGMIHYNK